MLRDITLEHIFFLIELWHLFDVNVVAGHGAVLAALLFASALFITIYKDIWHLTISSVRSCSICICMPKIIKIFQAV